MPTFLTFVINRKLSLKLRRFSFNFKENYLIFEQCGLLTKCFIKRHSWIQLNKFIYITHLFTISLLPYWMMNDLSILAYKKVDFILLTQCIILSTFKKTLNRSFMRVSSKYPWKKIWISSKDRGKKSEFHMRIALKKRQFRQMITVKYANFIKGPW